MTEQQIDQTEETDVTDDQLLQLPPERLVAMLRDKRKSEGTYRAKLRDAEAERDTLKGTVTGYQQKAFHQFAKGQNVQDTALEDVAERLDIASLLGEDGQVDEAAAKTALEDLRKSRPHYFVQSAGQSGGDFAGGMGEAPSRRQATWDEVLG